MQSLEIVVRPQARKTKALSAREKEVLQWLAFGKTANEIAAMFGISVCTVRVHIRGIRNKLKASNIPHAVSLALRAGTLHVESQPFETKANGVNAAAVYTHPVEELRGQ